METNAHVPLTARFMYIITKEENEVNQSLNSVWQWSLESKRDFIS